MIPELKLTRPGVAWAPHHQNAGTPIPLDFTSTGTSVGYQQIFLQYTNFGGTDNLVPGYPTVETAAVTWPPTAATGIVVLRGLYAQYPGDNLSTINDHDFGALGVSAYWQDSNTIAISFQLTDENYDKAVNLWAQAFVLFYG